MKNILAIILIIGISCDRNSISENSFHNPDERINNEIFNTIITSDLFSAFFGDTILSLSSNTVKESFMFLSCIKKKADGSYEKPSQGEGKTVKINIGEMAKILLILKAKIKSWDATHEYKEQKTFISFKLEKKGKSLQIIIGDYTKVLSQDEIIVFKIILKQIFTEKLISLATEQKPASN